MRWLFGKGRLVESLFATGLAGIHTARPATGLKMDSPLTCTERPELVILHLLPGGQKLRRRKNSANPLGDPICGRELPLAEGVAVVQ
jgi:hypothetical protein